MSEEYSLKYILLLLLLWTGACSILPHAQGIPYSLLFEDPQRIRFQGKGAAAGMMMSSSMGPMGIAIGVAIDEGIAKDIQAALDNSGCALESVVAGAFEQTSELHGRSALKGNSALDDGAVIRIHRIGFKVIPGETDPAYVTAELSIRFKRIDYLLRQPADNSEPSATAPLESLKANGKVTCRLLTGALQDTFNQWYERVDLLNP